VIARVAYPNDEVISKTMMALGDWYLAGYDLERKSNYELQVIFRSKDGKNTLLISNILNWPDSNYV